MISTDVCVVGTGAGGGPMAAVLAEAGLEVVMLERGPMYSPRSFERDELKYLYRQEFVRESNGRKVYSRSNGGHLEEVVGGRNPEMVGGSTVHYEARAWRLQQHDFLAKTLWGDSRDALADWPITYDELEPYYDRAEWELGVSGEAGVNPWEAWRSRGYPCSPLPSRSIERDIGKSCRRMGTNPFCTPVAIISTAYRGRSGCSRCGFCAGFGCGISAKSSTLATVIPRALSTGRARLITRAVAVRVEANQSGHVAGVVYKNREGSENLVRARVVVLSAGAIESARILLNSCSGRFPTGLANSSGLVGRHLMFHLFGWVEAEFPQPVGGFTGTVSNLAVDDYYRTDKFQLSSPRGGTCNLMVQALPISHALRAGPDRRIGRDLKDYLKSFDRTVRFHVVKDEMPSADNRVELHPTETDQWGVPVAVINHEYEPTDVQTAKYITDRATDILANAGGKITWTAILEDLKLDHHRLGTCRFGDNPSTSVLDRNCQTHDVSGLYVVDGSFFPTSGGYNPSLTIEANSFRVAERILESGKLGGTKVGKRT